MLGLVKMVNIDVKAFFFGSQHQKFARSSRKFNFGITYFLFYVICGYSFDRFRRTSCNNTSTKETTIEIVNPTVP